MSDTVSSRELIYAWIKQGYAYRLAQGNTRLKTHKTEYIKHVKHEMEVLERQGYIDYFLVCSDIVRFAKDHGIPVGPGRGSAAASVVCYLLRITEVDPLVYPLMDFSRFIVPGREDLPDIDIDFDDERRHEVRDHIVRRYGADRVANVGTFTKYKGKNSIDDVARVYSIPKFKAELAKSMLIERSGGDSRLDSSLADTLEMFPQAKIIFDEHPDLWKAVALEGNYRGMSTHAAGIVITNTPISDICAMYSREDKQTGEQLTAVSVNKYDAEHLGLMKIDVLGLSTMGVIRYALEYAGLTLEDLYRIPVNDPETIAGFTRNDVVGIFQFEGRATRLVGRDVRPDNFLELIDINGLSRPGPLFSGTTKEYIDVKHGKRKRVRLHPIIDEITKGTKGAIIYQEQILKALARFGGLPIKRVHEIRKIISLKLGEAQFNTSMTDFVSNAVQIHNVKPELAEDVWSRVVTSASYAFVYAHSLCYALIGYWCMYLKVHHPAAFYTAQLRKADEDKWARLIKDAERHGLSVHGVTPGVSQSMWTATQDGVIVAGWQQLKGVGEKTATKITEYAKTQQIKKADDLLPISGIGPATIERFRAQIESDDPFGLLKIKDSLDQVRSAISSREIPLRHPTVTSDQVLDVVGGRELVWIGMVKLKEYKDYIEDERARSGKDVEDIISGMKRPDLPTSCVLHCYDDGDEDVYIRITRFDYPRFKDALAELVVDRDVIWIKGRKSRGGFGASIYARRIAVIDPEDD